MNTTTPPADPANLATDPAVQIEFFKRRLRRYLRTAQPEDIDDLAQRCWIDLDRARAAREPDRIGALMEVIARRRAVDQLRRYRPEFARPDEDGNDPLDSVASPEPSLRDELERVRFVVHEFFTQRGATRCAELARGWFASQNWLKVAEQMGISHATARKSWERCVDRLKAEEEQAPGFLNQFLEFLH